MNAEDSRPEGRVAKQRPELKQFGDLTAEDFLRHPVWVQCHIVDYDESWHDDTDEETFRPWSGTLPVDPAEAMFLLRAQVSFPDGTSGEGFLTPAQDNGDIGSMQPQVFLGGRRFMFWGGSFSIAQEERRAFYAAAGRTPERAFPLRIAGAPGLSTGVISVTIEGFYRLSHERTVCET